MRAPHGPKVWCISRLAVSFTKPRSHGWFVHRDFSAGGFVAGERALVAWRGSWFGDWDWYWRQVTDYSSETERCRGCISRADGLIVIINRFMKFWAPSLAASCSYTFSWGFVFMQFLENSLKTLVSNQPPVPQALVLMLQKVNMLDVILTSPDF